MSREEALWTLSALADRAKAEGWHAPLPPQERAKARQALTALEVARRQEHTGREHIDTSDSGHSS